MAASIIPSSVPRVHSEVSPDQLAWLNDDPSNHPTDGYPGVGWDADRYEPSPEASAQEAGYLLGYQLDWAAQPPASLDEPLRLLWSIGKVEGVSARRRDDDEDSAFRRELAEAAHEAMDRHPDELVRSVGVIASRTEGGAR